ncbi:PREDICTED: probable cation transporter HKT7 [Nelumbo nucifera]|uniref:Probable cation transporter HKT7 n=1 Tax=Nelumbo nucifera TaxID=4432 RepID=A0A1U8ACU3_NELNU|nr:PREDICTED: probable cation transporter HKT7 [Nelumbo nucifera]
MESFHSLGKIISHLCSCSCIKIACFRRSVWGLMVLLFRFILFHINPFVVLLCYFVSVSFLGFLILKLLNPRTDSFKPKDLDIFFTSVSATTVSSMSTVEMEVFSNTQLVFITILMFVGGEVFVSMFGLLFTKYKLRNRARIHGSRVGSVSSESMSPTNPVDQLEIELGMVTLSETESRKPSSVDLVSTVESIMSTNEEELRYNSIRYLVFVIMGYLLVVHIGGSALVALYVSLVTSARDVLRNKGLQIPTFSIFITVSTFASCGFVPTNENMIVFSKNSGLLLLLIPQVLLGNTLYPSCLRFLIWVLGWFTKKPEFNYMLTNTREMKYFHLLPSLHSSLLVVTVFGFIVVQFILFCSLEWNSQGLDGMDPFQKLVAALFQTVNSRHTGESVIDLSILSPAILVLFVVMMYLPPYTSFLPIKDVDWCSRRSEKKNKTGGRLAENLKFSQLSYLVIFIIAICITEREKMKEDPLNFSTVNIVIEVISAYGNVGFTAGYSCKRQLNPQEFCKDTWYGFVGRWSNKGKVILILVMFFGRLKKFNMGGGKGWKLL